MHRVFTAVAVAALVLLSAAPAFAHVELATSSPAAGAVVDDPVDSITLVFTTDAAPAGDGIVLYDEDAEIVPSEIEVVSDTEVRIIPTSALDGGRYAIAWTMKAGDAHPKSGVVEFGVEAATPAVAPTTTPDEAPPPAEDRQPAPVQEASTSDRSDATASAPLPDARPPIISAAGTPAAGEWLGRIARGASMLASLLGIGALMFAYLIFEGSPREARDLGFWVRRAGLVLVVAAPLEVLGQSMLLNGPGFDSLTPIALAEAASGGLGIAVLLRLAGGSVMLASRKLSTVLRAATGPAQGGSGTTTMVRQGYRVMASPIAVTGALAVGLSFVFDGHSATEGPRLLVQASSLAHVLAAATWVGGVVFLAATLAGRHRRNEPLDAARLVIPFSTVASVAVVYVGLAGSVLALAIVDAPSDFFVTGWGRVLLAKLGLVGIAGAMGAFNHFVAVPALKRGRGDPALDDRLGVMMRIEAAVLVGVAVLSAVLVGLSP